MVSPESQQKPPFSTSGMTDQQSAGRTRSLPASGEFIEVPAGKNGELIVGFRFQPDEEGLPIVVATYERWAMPSRRDLNTTVKKKIDWGDVRRRAEKILVVETDWWLIDDYDLEPPSVQQGRYLPSDGENLTARYLDDLRKGRRPSRHSDRFYAEIASLYVAEGHSSARVHNRLKERGDHYAPQTVRRWIMEARDRGMLTATSRGKRGGELTLKAHRILRGEGSSQPRWTPFGRALLELVRPDAREDDDTLLTGSEIDAAARRLGVSPLELWSRARARAAILLHERAA